MVLTSFRLFGLADKIFTSIYSQDIEFFLILNPAPYKLRGAVFKMAKNVFHQFEFIDKNSLETQNPRRDTSNSRVSADYFVADINQSDSKLEDGAFPG